MEHVFSFILIDDSRGYWSGLTQIQEGWCIWIRFYQGFVEQVGCQQFCQKFVLRFAFWRIMPCWIVIITPFPGRSLFVSFPPVFLKFLLLIIKILQCRLRRVLWLVGVDRWILVGCSTYWLVRETWFSFMFVFNLDGIMKCIHKRTNSQKLHLLLNV